AADGRPGGDASRLGPPGGARPRQRAKGARPARALVLPKAGPAGRPTWLRAQPHRPLPRSRVAAPRPLPRLARRPGHAGPPPLPRPDRPAADARAVARPPRRRLSQRLRAPGGSPAGLAGLWGALGPALDGRVALLRLVWPALRPRRAEQLRDGLA